MVRHDSLKALASKVLQRKTAVRHHGNTDPNRCSKRVRKKTSLRNKLATRCRWPTLCELGVLTVADLPDLERRLRLLGWKVKHKIKSLFSGGVPRESLEVERQA